MKKVITTISKSFNQSEYVPYGYEIEFKEGSIFAPIHVKLSDDNDMFLVGKIDRIDILNVEDKSYARIVDYKSSSKDLSVDDIKEGLSLQLVTYLYAFIENMNKKEGITVLPSAMLYFNLSDKLVSLKNYTNDTKLIEKEIIKTLRMKGIFLSDTEIIKKMDKKVDSEERLIDISLRTINSNKSKRVLNQEDYSKLCTDATQILKQIGNEVLSGRVKIAPYKKRDVCKYCSYSSICRKDICL
ncbi:ATP-dependent helicase/deoxyribonuclease subunit B [compost metagenome]